MTRTKRIYNKRPIRLGPGYRGWIVSNHISEQDLFKHMVGDYHPWQQWGFMKGWRDWRLRSRRRQAWKAEERRVIDFEGFPDSWEWFNEIKNTNQHVPDIWEDLIRDPLAGLVDIYYDYIDWLDLKYDVPY